MNNYYVYIYLDPRKQSQHKMVHINLIMNHIYIGKGKENRYKRIKQDVIEIRKLCDERLLTQKEIAKNLKLVQKQ